MQTATMPVKERFDAAVNVIRSMPKNGTFQPSHEMMLRFYSFYKQATLGPCKQRRPAFWDVVNRAKWDAWNKLGDMPAEEAMLLYIADLGKIIETMAYTDNVASFIQSVEGVEGLSLDMLEAVAPNAIQKVRSTPASPITSREVSPIRDEKLVNGIKTNGVHHSETPDNSEDEYIDTVESEHELTTSKAKVHVSRKERKRRGDSLTKETLNNVAHMNDELHKLENHYAVNLCEQLQKTIDSMKADLRNANERVSKMERKTNQFLAVRTKVPQWWPFQGITPNWFLFLILWPFIAQRISNYLTQKRN
ncbi:acyl-CoA-binding domain-containing protein 5-like [Ctenocephalides felis]|uniref:acyl-CoA-binding domain-containing protein 5-like n=1 Tax=Ctenocephalides felis TaxID=7515 RepID=UPI000E6E3942|nr:acyl-CoA-binding domain-containing protein 5-like [Ctenocephalides felis]